MFYLKFEDENLNFSYNESNEDMIMIECVANGVECNYIPDFIIYNKYNNIDKIIEIKPYDLRNNLDDIMEQILVYCDNHNYKYKMLTNKDADYDIKRIAKLYYDGLIEICSNKFIRFKNFIGIKEIM